MIPNDPIGLDRRTLCSQKWTEDAAVLRTKPGIANTRRAPPRLLPTKLERCGSSPLDLPPCDPCISSTDKKNGYHDHGCGYADEFFTSSMEHHEHNTNCTGDGDCDNTHQHQYYAHPCQLHQLCSVRGMVQERPGIARMTEHAHATCTCTATSDSHPVDLKYRGT